MSRVPVLLDTDIGTNIDDALALAYLLRHPRCELLGITTVSGDTEARAQLARTICAAFGRPDVPVRSGAPETALPGGGHSAGQRWAEPTLHMLRDTIGQRAGEIVLLSIGPLTNIAALYAAAPDLPALLRGHVMMGGLYAGSVPGYGPAERNVGSDPEAAAIVFASGVSLRCMGLEVTARCTLPTGGCRSRFEAAGLGVLTEQADGWLARGQQEIRFHDPLAALSVFEPDLCRFERGCISVELSGAAVPSAAVPGRTHFTPDPHGPHEVAVSVDPDVFFEHFFAILGC